jgi:hypothetical protein
MQAKKKAIPQKPLKRNLAHPELRQYLRIPVINDGGIPASRAQQRELRVGQPLSIRFEDIIAAHEVHWRILDSAKENPPKFIEQEKNKIRQELHWHWDIQPSRNYYGRRNPPIIDVPAEHVKTGENIAEGIAVTLIERRMRIPRSQIFFVRSKKKKPRPDYAATRTYCKRLLAHRGVGTLQLAFEVRSRLGLTKIPPSHHISIKEKRKRCLPCHKGSLSTAATVRTVMGMRRRIFS